MPRPRPKPRRALDAAECQTVLNLLHAPRFADQAPAEIYASLLDQGVYHCSIRTMYRILATSQEVRERRQQLRHPVYKKPELLAQAPNEVWSWDITKLMGSWSLARRARSAMTNRTPARDRPGALGWRRGSQYR